MSLLDVYWEVLDTHKNTTQQTMMKSSFKRSEQLRILLLLNDLIFLNFSSKIPDFSNASVFLSFNLQRFLKTEQVRTIAETERALAMK